MTENNIHIEHSNSLKDNFSDSYTQMLSFKDNSFVEEFYGKYKQGGYAHLENLDTESKSNVKPKKTNTPVRRHNFSKEEDIIILNEVIQYISNHKKPDWKLIGAKTSRSARQVRQRFHVIGSSTNDTWTKDEIRFLLIAEHVFGHHNSTISSVLGSKFPYQVKKKLQYKKLIELSNNKTRMMIECQRLFKTYLPFQDEELIDRLHKHGNYSELSIEQNKMNAISNMAYTQLNQLNEPNTGKPKTRREPTVSELYSTLIGVPLPTYQSKIETPTCIPVQQNTMFPVCFPQAQTNFTPISFPVAQAQLINQSNLFTQMNTMPNNLSIIQVPPIPANINESNTPPKSIPVTTIKNKVEISPVKEKKCFDQYSIGSLLV